MRDKHGRKWYEYIDNSGNRYPAYADSTGRETVRTDRPLADDETIQEYINDKDSDPRA